MYRTEKGSYLKKKKKFTPGVRVTDLRSTIKSKGQGKKEIDKRTFNI